MEALPAACTSHIIRHNLGYSRRAAKFTPQLLWNIMPKTQNVVATRTYSLACATYRMRLDHQYFTALAWVTNPPRCERALIAILTNYSQYGMLWPLCIIAREQMFTQSFFHDKDNKRAKKKKMRRRRHRKLGEKSEREAAPVNTDGGSRLEISALTHSLMSQVSHCGFYDGCAPAS